MPSQSLYVNFYLLSTFYSRQHSTKCNPWVLYCRWPDLPGPGAQLQDQRPGEEVQRGEHLRCRSHTHVASFATENISNIFLIGSVANFPVKSERITGKRSLLRNCKLLKIEILIEMEIYLYSSKHDIIIDNLNWIVMSFSAKFKRRKRYKFGECLHLLIYFILVWFPICQLPTFHLNKLSGRGTGFKDYVELKNENSEYIYLFPVFSKCISIM